MFDKRERFYRFSAYLKEHFGATVYKVSIDAGFSCPNKDGRISKDGCIYCENRSFSFNTRFPPRPIEEQIEEGMNFGRKRYNAEKFIAYFQAYTNTYAPPDILKSKYDTVKKFPDIVGISIGTRPDCVNKEILEIINSFTKDYEVWLEYGLQSIHKKTLAHINRGHLYEDFLEAVNLTGNYKDIKICGHVIIGLPGETREDILDTAKEMGRLNIDGIKIHPLHVVRGTKLEEFFNRGLYKTLELEGYADLVTEFLEYLSPRTIIQRMTADCPREVLIGPMWIMRKGDVLNRIDTVMLEKNRFQAGKNGKGAGGR